jgi:hypothetical protein
VPTDLLRPEDVDLRLNWPPGRTAKLIRQRSIPYYILPDGAFRLSWDEIAPLIVRVDSSRLIEAAAGGLPSGR